jgi:hypothetical protein
VKEPVPAKVLPSSIVTSSLTVTTGGRLCTTTSVVPSIVATSSFTATFTVCVPVSAKVQVALFAACSLIS